jgi:hypothetical protein
MEKKFGFIRFVPSKQVFEHLLMAPSDIGKDIDKNQLDQGLSWWWSYHMVVGFTTTYAISAYHH